MKQFLKIEFERVFKNRVLYLSLCIGLLIAVSHVVFNVLPFYNKIYLDTYPLTIFEKWMGGENSSIQPTLFYMLNPILISLPYMGTIKQDMETGYIKNIFIRTQKRNYFISKYIITFVTSGILSVIPLLVNLILTAMILPATIPQSCVGFYTIQNTSLFAELFYTHPYMYIGIYMIINAIFFGLLTTLGLTISFIADNVFVVILSPFLIYLFVYAITQLTNLHEFCPYGFLRPSQPIITKYFTIGIEMAVMLLIGGVVYLYVATKKETF